MNNIIDRWYHTASTAAVDGKKVNFYINNLKFILIILVVLGHFTAKMAYVKEIKYIFYFIYIFHMPCFIFINGYLAKRMNAGGKLRVNKIFSLLWIYVIFKVGLVVCGRLLQHNIKLSLFTDSAAPWYLLALCIWYLLVPVLERIKEIYLIPGSFLIGLLVGYISGIGDVFSLSRVFVFLPYFILGFCLSEDKLERFLNRRLRIPALFVLAVIMGCMVLFWKQIIPIRNIIYGASSYKAALGKLSSKGLIIRGAWYLLALLASAALMLLVPRCKLFISKLGERTLQVYVTHVWIRNILVYAGFFAFVRARSEYLPDLMLLGCILLTFLLSNRWFKKLFDWLMAPELFNKILKKESL